MATVQVTKGQSLIDIAIQEYGSIAALCDLALDNGLEVDSDLTAGQVLQIRDELPSTADPDVVEYFVKNGFKVNSGVVADVIEVIGTNDDEVLGDNDLNGLQA